MTDEIIELSCNLDDMTPEGVGFALETLLAEGALDAFTTAIGMKKSRPGVMLTCLCRPEGRRWPGSSSGTPPRWAYGRPAVKGIPLSGALRSGRRSMARCG